jgi:pimeloyl-ACP methyl ester carboxylesterase
LTQVVRVTASRDVTVDVCGAPSGTPIFLFHGTPGSHRGPRPRTSILYRLGIRLISYDRPGYGMSTRHLGRTVADAVGDVAAIADWLELPEFGVVGRSGGGPHALSCAALLGDRVSCAAVLVGLAPADAKDLGWYEGMTASNVREFNSAEEGRPAALANLAAHAERVRADPEMLLRSLRPELASPDRRIVDDVAIRKLLTDTYEEALRDGSDGWIDDVLALRSPWGFDLAAIDQPVLLWHGAKDGFSPVTHAYWLADRIRTSVIEVEPECAHFGAVEILPKALAWVKDRAAQKGCTSRV